MSYICNYNIFMLNSNSNGKSTAERKCTFSQWNERTLHSHKNAIVLFTLIFVFSPIMPIWHSGLESESNFAMYVEQCAQINNISYHIIT